MKASSRWLSATDSFYATQRNRVLESM